MPALRRRDFISLLGGAARVAARGARAAAGGAVIGFSLEALGFRSQP